MFPKETIMLHFKDVSRVKVMNPFCIKYMYRKYKAICEYVYNMVKKMCIYRMKDTLMPTKKKQEYNLIHLRSYMYVFEVSLLKVFMHLQNMIPIKKPSRNILLKNFLH